MANAIETLKPISGVKASGNAEFPWESTDSEPLFELAGVEALAGHWVMLEANVRVEGQLTTPFVVRQYLSSVSPVNPDTRFALFPDSSGRVSYLWRAAPGLERVTISPIGQAGRFSIAKLRVRALLAPEAGVRSLMGALRHYRLSDIPRKFRSMVGLLRSGGVSSVARVLLGAHNQRARTTFSEQRSTGRSGSTLALRRLSASNRLDVLEGYLAENLRRASSAKDERYVEKPHKRLDADKLSVRLLAFYLPQFHPIPENDEWWGKGFTEWTNVSKATAQFVGHYQPHLPGELGFYDLRLPEVMRQQVDLAKHFGIGGFCFYYYWFGGRRLLERPLQMFLENPGLDIGFCYCWANENWSRRWDGLEDSILLAQQHSPEDDIAFIDALADAFRDPRYVRVDGKPLLIVYQVALLPDAAATAQRWRRRVIELGFDGIHLVAAKTFDMIDVSRYGFDAVVEFPPHQTAMQDISGEFQALNPEFRGRIYDFEELAKRFGKEDRSDQLLYKTVMPSWDNDARKPGAGHTFVNATPRVYAAWLADACRVTASRALPDHRMLFVNAWNEWAEGAHLEPDRRWGYAYLDATARVLSRYYRDPELNDRLQAHNAGFVKRHDAAVVVHLYFEDLYDELFERYLRDAAVDCDLVFSVKPEVDTAIVDAIVQSFPNSIIMTVENRGRDIRPFLLQFRMLRELGYQFICKIHSKKSIHRDDGDRWRRSLIDPMLEPDARVNCLRRFRQSSELGMLIPTGCRMTMEDPAVYLGSKRQLDEVLVCIGQADKIDRYEFFFPAGSMYWLRVAAYEALGSLDIERFEEEAGQLDGTYAHAIERVMALIAIESGYAVEEC